MNSITVATFGNIIDANLFRIELLSYGINSSIVNEHVVTALPFYVMVFDGIKVDIHPNDIESVKELFPILELQGQYIGTVFDKIYSLVREFLYKHRCYNGFLMVFGYIMAAVGFTCGGNASVSSHEISIRAPRPLVDYEIPIDRRKSSIVLDSIFGSTSDNNNDEP